jgi:hypothetical protein
MRLRYEPKQAPPISTRRFVLRLLGHGGAVTVIILASLGVGMWGYGHYEHLAWRDAFLNASMLMGGMGPVETPQSPGGKLFAGCYALYSGLVFIASTGILFVPVAHRILHYFHWQDGKGES